MSNGAFAQGFQSLEKTLGTRKRKARTGWTFLWCFFHGRPSHFSVEKGDIEPNQAVRLQRAQIPRFPSNAALQATPNREEFPANNAKKGFLTLHVKLCPQFKLTHFTVTSPRIKSWRAVFQLHHFIYFSLRTWQRPFYRRSILKSVDRISFVDSLTTVDKFPPSPPLSQHFARVACTAG